MRLEDYIDKGEQIAKEVSSSVSANFKGQDWSQGFALALQKKLKDRGVGGKLDLVSYDDTKGAEHDIRSMANLLIPSDWINKSNQRGKIHVHRTKSRQWHKFYKQNDSVTIDELPQTIHVTAGDSVILTAKDEIYDNMHEFIHRLQNVFTNIQAMFQDVHDKRTANEDIAPLYQKIHEVGKKDAYIIPYFGRVYAHGGALELWPMSCQAIIGNFGEYYQRMFLDKDPKLAYLTIGVLFYYKDD